MLTSTDFRDSNNILLEASIIRRSTAKCGTWPVQPAEFQDVIDLNGNGAVDIYTKTEKPHYAVVVAEIHSKEPSMVLDYAAAKRWAKEHDTEVITDQDIKDPGTQKLFQRYVFNAVDGDYEKVDWQGATEKDGSLQKIVDDVVAGSQGNPDAHWAIDVNQNKFLVYTKKTAFWETY